MLCHLLLYYLLHNYYYSLLIIIYYYIEVYLIILIILLQYFFNANWIICNSFLLLLSDNGQPNICSWILSSNCGESNISEVCVSLEMKRTRWLPTSTKPG